jgi:hypothetical protein
VTVQVDRGARRAAARGSAHGRVTS